MDTIKFTTILYRFSQGNKMNIFESSDKRNVKEDSDKLSNLDLLDISGELSTSLNIEKLILENFQIKKYIQC